jgi:hypothetical protein
VIPIFSFASDSWFTTISLEGIFGYLLVKVPGITHCYLPCSRGICIIVSELMALWSNILNFLMGDRSLLPPGLQFHPTDMMLIS